jgi:AraC-like DNA-binding protein
VGAGERTLSRLFRAETGMTFPQWRAQLRLHHFLALLASGLPVTATAITCGYSTPSAFTAAFRATFGTAPGVVPLPDLQGRQLRPGPAPGRAGLVRAACLRPGVMTAGLGPVAAHPHVAPAAAGVLAEIEEQPAAVPLARAFPDPVERPVRQEFRG